MNGKDVAKRPAAEAAVRLPGHEIGQLIEKARGEGPYSSRELAHEILDRLRREDPRLLQQWLEVQAEDLLWYTINKMDRADRGYARRTSARSVFAQAAGAASEPERRQALTSWLTTRHVTAEGLRVELGAMRKADLTYVARTYQDRANSNLLQVEFMNALARRVGRGTVADHFDEETLTKLWLSCLE